MDGVVSGVVEITGGDQNVEDPYLIMYSHRYKSHISRGRLRLIWIDLD